MKEKNRRKKIGIPQALLYYKYYPFWRVFLENLGFQVLVSLPTNREIFDLGLTHCIDEACLAVKIFCGHVAVLKDKVDYLFIPRIASVEKKGFLCTKFWGLPDLVRNLFPDARILDPNIDLNKSSLLWAYLLFSIKLTKNPFKILKSLRRAYKSEKKFLYLMQKKKLTPLAAIEVMEKEGFSQLNRIKDNESNYPSESGSSEIKIALLSHPYNLYDNFINLSIFKRLQNLGVEIFVPEMISKKELLRESKSFWNIYWTYNRELAAAATYFIKKGIDGIIFVVCFPCGPDSIIIDFLIRSLSKKIPLLNLVIDEHQADAGFLTRLESFVDILRKRKKERS